MFRLKKIGEVQPVASINVKRSKLGLGFEKLDRDVFDPEKAYPYVAQTGVKWIRIQSGWTRTEKVKGEYDFAWLDAIVDNLLKIGTMPWICLCYGNALYSEAAKTVFGAVGIPPVKTEEERKAWYRYVFTLVSRYKARGVDRFEVWNEPDGPWCWKHGPSGKEYGEFVKATAAAIHEANPAAKVIVGSVCMHNLGWTLDMCETGCLDNVWGFTYHCYSADETENPHVVRFYKSILKKYNPAIKIIQGESGSQSRPDGAGALNGLAWTQEKQAKQLLRHTVSDLLCDVEFMSFFSTMDMVEALCGTVGDKSSYMDYGYFGILSATFDEDGRSTGEYTPKKSFKALQVLASLFKEEPEVTEDIIYFLKPQSSKLMNYKQEVCHNDIISGGFNMPNGNVLFTYWKPTDLINMSIDETMTIAFGGFKKLPKLIDPMIGTIYALPDEMVEWKNEIAFHLNHIPLRDYPLFLLFEQDAPCASHSRA